MKISIIFGLLFIFGFVGFVYIHEQVHVAIYRGYGIDSRVEYFSHFPDVVTIADESCPTEICTALNSMNEIISYPLAIFYMVFGMGIFLLLILRELNNEYHHD